MKFNLQQFYKFCAELKIETKEAGLQKMGKLLGTQTYTMSEMAYRRWVSCWVLRPTR